MHFCPIACQPRKGMTSGDTVTFPRMAEDQLDMEPENTSLEKENRNIFPKLSFSGSMLIFGGCKRRLMIDLTDLTFNFLRI